VSALSRKTQRWQPIVIEEAARAKVPFGCMMRLIERESEGVAGLKGKRKAKSGWPFGLTQVTPIGLQEYNRLNPHAPISEVNLMGFDVDSGRIQIRAGCFLWSIGWNEYKGAPTDYDRAALADLAYAKGGRRLRELVAEAAAAGYPVTLAGLSTYDPNWTGTERPFDHAAFVAAGVGEPPDPLAPVGPSPMVAIAIGVLAGLGLLLVLVGCLR
jgi:hypothetical protein